MQTQFNPTQFRVQPLYPGLRRILRTINKSNYKNYLPNTIYNRRLARSKSKERGKSPAKTQFKLNIGKEGKRETVYQQVGPVTIEERYAEERKDSLISVDDKSFEGA